MFASCTGDGIRWNEEINIASAVAMDGGLITPVLKSADKTDIYQLSREWRDLVKRARAKKLSPDEFTTGTFTISNLGMMGVDAFDAITSDRCYRDGLPASEAIRILFRNRGQ